MLLQQTPKRLFYSSWTVYDLRTDRTLSCLHRPSSMWFSLRVSCFLSSTTYVEVKRTGHTLSRLHTSSRESHLHSRSTGVAGSVHLREKEPEGEKDLSKGVKKRCEEPKRRVYLIGGYRNRVPDEPSWGTGV